MRFEGTIKIWNDERGFGFIEPVLGGEIVGVAWHPPAWAGGWPGAIIAQQLLRYKSNKASFRSAFWTSVVGNVPTFVVLASPLFRQMLAG